jgi:hypothetical protein
MRYGTPYSRVLSPRWAFFQQVDVMLRCLVVPHVIFFFSEFFFSDPSDDTSEFGVSYRARRLLGIKPK